MNGERWIIVGCILLSAALYATASGPEAQEAYLFPRMLAITMLIVAVAMLVSGWVVEKEEDIKSVLSRVPWARVWPAFVILFLYMLTAEWLGFYLAAFLTFVSVGMTYSSLNPSVATLKRCVPISFIFMAVLYGVFTLLLQVRMPAGLLF
jgi:hypothetical protein